MSDAEQIRALLIRYARALDARDWDTFAAVFTGDAMIDYTSSNGPRGGIADVLPWLRDALSLFEMSQHIVGNEVIEVNGNEATSSCLLYNPMIPVQGDMLLVGGHYDDRLRRVDGRWLFSERIQHLDWMSTLKRLR
jgi:hypothetical protein